MQGSDEASIDPVTSVRSDLAVWSAGAFICCGGLSVHHTQCFSGNTRHLYYGWAIIHIYFQLRFSLPVIMKFCCHMDLELLFCLVLHTLSVTVVHCYKYFCYLQ